MHYYKDMEKEKSLRVQANHALKIYLWDLVERNWKNVIIGINELGQSIKGLMYLVQ